MLEIKKPKLKGTKKMQGLLESINKDNIAKVEKFLKHAYMKSTKGSQVG